MDQRPVTLGFSGVSVSFRGRAGEVEALRGIDLAVHVGEIVALIGPSGCGKSTLLRLAADLLTPTAGEVRVTGTTPHEARLARRIACVFQDAALLDWRSVLQNVALPLELAGTGSARRIDEARRVLAAVGLSRFERAHPYELSGGMRQRVAIARAMVQSPDLLLLDEPFGALDQITRDRMNLELLGLVEASHVTTILVTHSIREAVLMADRVVIMSSRPGRITRIMPIDAERPRRLAFRDSSDFHDLVREGTAELERGIDP
ncbi:MAG: ABC transporter ATP-binding protein [Geminicoccaceae bacterium]